MKSKTVKASDYCFVVESYIEGEWRVVVDIPLVVVLKMTQLFPFDPSDKDNVILIYPTRYFFKKIDRSRVS